MSTGPSPYSRCAPLPSVDSHRNVAIGDHDDTPILVELPPNLTSKILHPFGLKADGSPVGGASPLSDYDFPGGIIDEIRSAVAYAFSYASQTAAGAGEDNLEALLPNPNISLYCPHEGTHEIIDAIVDVIALERGADVVVLDPLELALGKDGIFGEGIERVLRSIYNDQNSREAQALFDAIINIQSDDDAGRQMGPHQRIVYLRDFGTIARTAVPLMSYVLQALRTRRTAKSVAGGLSMQTLQPTILIMGFSQTPDAWDNGRLKQVFSGGGRLLRDTLPLLDQLQYSQATDPHYPFLSPIAAAVFLPILFNSYNIEMLSPNAFFYDRPGVGQLRREIQDNAVCICIFPKDAHTPKVQTILRRLSSRRKKDMWNAWITILLHNLGGQIAVPGSMEALEELSMQTSLSVPLIIDRIVKQALKLSTTEVGDSIGPILVTSTHLATAYGMFVMNCEAQLDWVKWSRPNVRGSFDEEKELEKGFTLDPIYKPSKGFSNKYEERLMSTIVDIGSLTTSFDNVCVSPHIIESLRSIVSLPLLHPAAFKTGILSLESIGGILLYGPPGTGKTMACRALAKECKAHMLEIKPSDVMDMYLGETENLVRAIFSLARRLAPCVIFIDELDALFRARKSNDQTWHRNMLNEFMQGMDGLQSAKQNKDAGLTVIGATNRPYDLDNAVLRRFPTRMMVDLPSPPQRERILRVHLAGENLGEDLDISFIARRAENYSGSELKDLCVSAAMDSVKALLGGIKWNPQPSADEKSDPANEDKDWGSRVIGLQHFEHAFTDIRASSTLMSHAELYSWHEQYGAGKNLAKGRAERQTGLSRSARDWFVRTQ